MKDVHFFLLAGGESKRFQKGSKIIDKALLVDEKWGNVPLLINAIKLFNDLNVDLTIIVNDNTRKETYLDALSNHGLEKINIITDNKEFSMRGPLNSMLTGCQYSKKPYCLFYPIDMPYIKQDLVELLYSLRQMGDIISFFYPDGKIEPLFSLINKEKIIEIAAEMNEFRKDRPSALFRGVEKLFFISIDEVMTIEHNLKSFININDPGSIKITKLNIPKSVKNVDSFKLIKNEIEKSQLAEILEEFPQIKTIKYLNYLMASYLEKFALLNLTKRRKCLKLAIKYYSNEKVLYDKHNLKFLSRHVDFDIKRCKVLLKKIYEYEH